MKAKYPCGTIVFSMLLLVFVHGTSRAQTDTSLLCQGNYWTEEEAREKMDQFAGTYHDRASWELRADRIRQTILKGAGLTPLPKKTALMPIIRSKKIMDGYTVENVAYQSMPGFWVTGNLYRPVNAQKKLPGVLCPHGHWEDGRFRADMQLRCASMAKMGAVVFAYDMVGYGESVQTDHQNSLLLKIQTWNSIRAVDFLLSLPEVDAEKIAVTGASGGGTQSFLLAAIDPRVAVSAPVVMIAAHFFGGCICESGMPVHKARDFQTNNVEIAACAAPRPMLMLSDGDDWTKNNPEVEYPYIKRIYGYYNAGYRLQHVHFADEGHDYGQSKRLAVYEFFARHLGLNIGSLHKDDRVDESFVKILARAELCVFDANHPRPQNAVKGDKQVLALFGGTKDR